MALLFSCSFISFASSSVTGFAATQPSLRLYKSIALVPRNPVRSSFWAPLRGCVVVKASAEADGSGSTTPISSDAPKEDASLQNVATLDLKLEQKMRMKMAKKIRLRRKRLLRKRHLRKKGRWPPSKMKKNKNV